MWPRKTLKERTRVVRGKRNIKSWRISLGNACQRVLAVTTILSVTKKEKRGKKGGARLKVKTIHRMESVWGGQFGWFDAKNSFSGFFKTTAVRVLKGKSSISKVRETREGLGRQHFPRPPQTFHTGREENDSIILSRGRRDLV